MMTTLMCTVYREVMSTLSLTQTHRPSSQLVVKPETDIVGGENALKSEQENCSLTKVVGVLTAVPSPVKRKKKGGGKSGFKGPRIMPKFDVDRQLPDLVYSDTDKAVVWDEAEGEYKNSKIISYATDMQGTDLPITAEREPGQDVVGSAAQAFNINQATDDVPGWISGHVVLPPQGIKDAEGVGMCSQIFFVSSCQPKSFEVAIGAPEETSFNPDTAQRFLLSAGDFFHVPPNNIYRVENHSDSYECKLFWTIVRPMAKQEEEE